MRVGARCGAASATWRVPAVCGIRPCSRVAFRRLLSRLTVGGSAQNMPVSKRGTRRRTLWGRSDPPKASFASCPLHLEVFEATVIRASIRAARMCSSTGPLAARRTRAEGPPLVVDCSSSRSSASIAASGGPPMSRYARILPGGWSIATCSVAIFGISPSMSVSMKHRSRTSMVASGSARWMSAIFATSALREGMGSPAATQRSATSLLTCPRGACGRRSRTASATIAADRRLCRLIARPESEVSLSVPFSSSSFIAWWMPDRGTADLRSCHLSEDAGSRKQTACGAGSRSRNTAGGHRPVVRSARVSSASGGTSGWTCVRVIGGCPCGSRGRGGAGRSPGRPR